MVVVAGLAGGPAAAAPSPTPRVSLSPRVSPTPRVSLSAAAKARSPDAAASSPVARVLVTTTRSTVHAAGSSVPAWGLAFLLAVFVVAVALALPSTRRRSARSST